MDKSFSDILKDLDFAAMVNLQARKGRFGLYTDVTVPGAERHDRGHQCRRRHGSSRPTTSLDSWIVDFGASWEAARWGGSGPGKSGFVDLFLGGRYWSIDDRTQGGEPRSSPASGASSKAMDWVDPIVGARFAADLTPKLTLIGRGDVGGFDLGERLEADVVRERLPRLALQPPGQRLGRLEAPGRRARGRQRQLDRPGLQRSGARPGLHLLIGGADVQRSGAARGFVRGPR